MSDAGPMTSMSTPRARTSYQEEGPVPASNFLNFSLIILLLSKER